MLEFAFAEFPSLVYEGETRRVGKTQTFQNIQDKKQTIDLLIMTYGHGPMSPVLREYAHAFFVENDIAPRDYRAQVEGLCNLMRSFYYINEGKETILSPYYVLQKQYGDCDDLVVTLGALLRSIGYPVKTEILKWDGRPRHIYLRAGIPPRNPTEWIPLETTVDLPYNVEPRDVAEDALRRRRQE